ncbi:MAG TPA: 2-hydroxychromene-2-carboxylate isomerase [Eoetvoesiella sp.]
MQSPIAFYFDFFSPYGYFASTQIEALAARHGRSVDWRPMLLGVTVMQIMGMKPLMETPLKSDYIRHDKVRMAQLLGVPFADHGLSGVQSVNALRAFLWLKAQDPVQAVAFAHAMYRRLWVEGLDITPAEVSAHEVAVLGGDADALLVAINSAELKQALRAEVQASIDLGVFGAPYFIVDGEPFWGVDRLWMLEHWLTHRSWAASADPVQL